MCNSFSSLTFSKFFFILILVFEVASIDIHSVESRNQIFHALVLSNPGELGIYLSDDIVEVLCGITQTSTAWTIGVSSKVDPLLAIKNEFAADAGPQLLHAAWQKLSRDELGLGLFSVLVTLLLSFLWPIVVVLSFIAVLAFELLLFLLDMISRWHVCMSIW